MQRWLALITLFLLATTVPVNAQTNSPTNSAASPDLHLTNASVADVVDIYCQLSDRTALLSPQLPVVTISLQIPLTNRTAATQTVVAALEAKGILVVPDGKNLAMIIPKSRKETLPALSSKIKSYTPSSPTKDAVQQLIRKGEVDFRHATPNQMADLYAALVGRRMDPASTYPPTAKGISFYTQSELTVAEVRYALETLLYWHNIRLVPVGKDLLRAEPVSPK